MPAAHQANRDEPNANTWLQHVKTKCSTCKLPLHRQKFLSSQNHSLRHSISKFRKFIKVKMSYFVTPFRAPKLEPKIEKPSAVAAALARRSPSPPPIPSPPAETIDFPAPPSMDFPRPPPFFKTPQNDYPKPPPMTSSLQPDPVKTSYIPKVSNIVG